VSQTSRLITGAQDLQAYDVKNSSSATVSTLAPFQHGYFIALFDSRSDPYGTHKLNCIAHSASFLRFGYLPVIYDLSERQQWSEAFLKLLRVKHPVLVHCEQGHGLDLGYFHGKQHISLAQSSGKYFISHMRDFPFYDWVRSKFSRLGNNHHIFHAIQSNLEFFNDSDNSRGHHHICSNIYLDYAPNSKSIKIPPSKRPISLLYVGSYVDPNLLKNKFLQLHPDHGPLFDYFFDLCRYESKVTLLELAKETKKTLLDESIHLGNSLDDNLLSYVSRAIHSHRRSALLQKLAKYPAYIVWSGPLPKDISFHSAATVVGSQNLGKTLGLIENSRAMAMSILFNDALSERMLTAMSRNCVALVNRSRILQDQFCEDEELLLFTNNLDDIDSRIAQAQDNKLVDGISVQARRKVLEAYAPSIYAERVLQTLQLAPFC